MRTRLAATLVAAALGIGPVALADPAWAAQGSVPPPVAAFVEHQLIDRLDDADGLRAGGTVDFRQATPGPITQVFFFTEDSRAGRSEADPVIPRDDWVVPIDVSGLPVGSAIVSLEADAAVVRVESWDPGAPFAAAVSTLCPSATLVRDLPTSSWFSVEGGVAHPIVAGTSGVTTARPLSRLDLDQAPPKVDDVNPATVRALAALVALVGLALLAIGIPRLVARARARRIPNP